MLRGWQQRLTASLLQISDGVDGGIIRDPVRYSRHDLAEAISIILQALLGG